MTLRAVTANDISEQAGRLIRLPEARSDLAMLELVRALADRLHEARCDIDRLRKEHDAMSRRLEGG